jgi:hypothetical protein
VPGYGKQTLDRAVTGAAASPSRAGAVLDRHAARLYRQALLTLGDPGLAEQVVSDVVTEECLRPDSLDGQEYRLAVSVRRRCQELATDPVCWNRLRDPLDSVPGCIVAGGVSVRERAALALVIFGHLGYAEAARELAISPPEMAALLQAVLGRLTAADARA